MKFITMLAALLFTTAASAHDIYHPWKLSPEQHAALQKAVTETPRHEQFEIWFYPLGRGTGLPPDQYGTEIFRIFKKAGWPVGMPAWNWVAPETVGLKIAVCPHGNDRKDRPSDDVYLAFLLRGSGIPFGLATEDDLVHRACAAGLVIGKPQ